MKNKYINTLFLIFIISLPFSWANVGSMSIYRIVTIVTFGVWLVYHRFQIPIPNGINRKLFNAWILYAGYTIIAYLLLPSDTNTLFGMILLVLISLIFFSTKAETTTHKYIDYTWIIVGYFFVMLFILGRTSQVGWGTRQTLTILGTKTDPNEFASFFIVALSITLNYFLCEKGVFSKIVLSVLLVSGTYVVLMSGSRGALISLVVALLVTFLSVKKKSLQTIVLTVIAALVIMMVLPKYILPLIPTDTLSRLSIEALMNDNGSGRSDIWRAALQAFTNANPIRWLIGYGYGGLKVTTWIGTTGTMHNQYIQQLIAYGVIGFVLYIRLIITAYKSMNVCFRRYRGAFIGILVMGLTITMGPSYKILWILLFLLGVTVEDTAYDEDK